MGSKPGGLVFSALLMLFWCFLLVSTTDGGHDGQNNGNDGNIVKIHALVKRQHVNVSTKYWSVVNELDVKQTKSIFNRLNPFSDKLVTIKTFTPHAKAAFPSCAGTTKHVYKKHKTKQGTTPGRGQQLLTNNMSHYDKYLYTQQNHHTNY